jgi:cobalt-precorrin 5A hydrolase/precorrin-3B C17-methyltransferase
MVQTGSRRSGFQSLLRAFDLIFQDFQPIAAIATTPIGANQLLKFAQIDGITLWLPNSLLSNSPALNAQWSVFHTYTGSLKNHLATLWNTHRSLVFCLATGAVVRLIAPLLEDKASDPAVVVIDETGQFVLSLCGGHQAGADQLARLIALQLGATPVLTGSANRAALPGIDVLGVPFGWQKGEGDWTGVSAAIARHAPVQIIQEAGSTLWQKHLPDGHPFQFPATGNRQPATGNPESPQARVWITPFTQLPTSPRPQALTPSHPIPEACWHPRVLWVGIGCERGTSKTLIQQAVQQVFQAHHLSQRAIAGVATIDLKADEMGLVEFCHEHHWPLRCFPAEALRTVPVPNPSAIVEAEVGTPSVAEAAALLGATQVSALDAQSEQPAEVSLPVPKHIIRQAGEAGAVTIAVAQAQQEYTGRTGKLWLVGIGPGQLDQITPAVQTAIAQADAVIGYSLYIDLVKPLLRPGQIVEALPITQERQRAERAIALADWGLAVAVISSGDCGIYGMAGLVLEQLHIQGWDGHTPEVQVFPGITALQAAASRVGAPLMHDFCAISLSDLLTPWEVIEKRLIAAAQADFVVALYNPKSQTRTHQIETAQQIFLKYRDRKTPVAIVRSAYRPDEQVTITALAEFLQFPIDMLTLVLIGNQSSRTHTRWVITPRGYLGFDAE